MTGNAPSSNQWDVLVTLDATVSAWLKVEASSFEQAGDIATSHQFVIENSNKFELDEDNFDSWAYSATLPDPDNGIVPHGPDSPVGSTITSLTESQRQILKEASEAYSSEEGFDLLDTTNPEVTMDGLALFISHELQDSMKGEEEGRCRVEAARSIMTAIKQLEEVLYAIDR